MRIEKLDFEESKAILKGTITNLANLKEQWTRLAKFFSFIANIIKVEYRFRNKVIVLTTV